MGQSEYVSPQQSPEVLARKVKAYGLHPILIDGHDPEAIRKALAAKPPKGKPVVVIARTVKGWGVKEMQKVGFHGKPLTREEMAAALKELALPAEKPDMALCPPMPKGEIPTVDRGPIAMPDPDLAKLAGGDEVHGRPPERQTGHAAGVRPGAAGPGPGLQADRGPRRRRVELDVLGDLRGGVPRPVRRVPHRRAEHGLGGGGPGGRRQDSVRQLLRQVHRPGL